MNRFPCPCCGHLTLPDGPGDYELCPVCFWEDDGGQLRFPMSPDGANGISLAEAQQVYARLGAMAVDFKRKVRKPRADEPLDEGWRPFDPARDWTNPSLDAQRWPVNAEALYYWRPTYWDGDQHKLPLPPREESNEDRLMRHLRQVPEFREAIAASEQRWGVANSFDVCGAAADLVLEAYRAGDEELGRRVVTSLLPAVEEGSETYVPNCVAIAFLENEDWNEPSIQEYIDRWPVPIREDLRNQQTYQQANLAAAVRRREEWAALHRSGRGQPVEVNVERLRALWDHEYDDPSYELGLQGTARVFSNRHWLYRHPVDSLRLAWRYRSVRHPWRTLVWLRRPRFTG